MTLKTPFRFSSPKRSDPLLPSSILSPTKPEEPCRIMLKRENKPQITILTINNKYKQKFITACVMRLFRVTNPLSNCP